MKQMTDHTECARMLALKSEQYVSERIAHEKLRKAALAVVDEFTGAEDGEYPAVENLLKVLNTR